MSIAVQQQPREQEVVVREFTVPTVRPVPPGFTVTAHGMRPTADVEREVRAERERGFPPGDVAS